MSWDEIYKHRGIVQRSPMRAVQFLSSMLAQDLRARSDMSSQSFRCAMNAHRLDETYQGLAPHEERLRILDAGCGTGRHALYLGREFASAEVDGFDCSAESLRLLCQQAELEKLDERIWTIGLDLDDELSQLRQRGPYEAIVSTLVIHHGTWAQILSRFHRLSELLKDGGLFAFAAISERDARASTGYEVEPRTRLDTAQDDGDLPHHFFNRSDLDALFGGYEILLVEETVKPAVTAAGDSVHWEVVARKVPRVDKHASAQSGCSQAGWTSFSHEASVFPPLMSTLSLSPIK